MSKDKGGSRDRRVPATTTERVRVLAESFDYVTEVDFMELCGITASTAEAWRKRHQGPDYALVGNRVLYPRASVRAFLDARVRQAKPGTAGGGL